MQKMNEYEILSRCLNDHCVSDRSDKVFICEDVYEFNEGRMGSKAGVGAKLRCPVSLLHKFWNEYDSSVNFSNKFNVKCSSELKTRDFWLEECEKAFESKEEFGRFNGIGPVFECSKVYSYQEHHLMFISAWYDPCMGFSGFYYYTGIELKDLNFRSKYLCSVS